MSEVQYQPATQDVVEAFQAIYRTALASWRGVLWFTAFGAFLTLVLTLAMMGLGSGPWPMTALATGLSVVTMLVTFIILNLHVFVPAAAQRLLGKRPDGAPENVLRWGDDQISIRGHKGEAIAAWPDFKRYVETPRSLVLIPDPTATVFILPKAAIGSQGLAEIHRHLARHGVRRASFRNA